MSRRCHWHAVGSRGPSAAQAPVGMTQKIEELVRVRVGSAEPSPPRRCSNVSSSRGVAESMAGEFQKSILEVGAMDVKLDDFLADFGGALDHVGNLVKGGEG